MTTPRLLTLALQLALTASMIGALPAQAGPVSDRLKEGGKIVVAYRSDVFPFSFEDAKGKPAGYAIEMCQNMLAGVQKKLGIKKLNIDYKKVTGKTRLETVIKHEADIECGSTFSNAERAKSVSFTVPHFITGTRLMVPTTSAVKELVDLRGKKIAIGVGTTAAQMVKKMNADAGLNLQLIEYPDNEKAFAAVVGGQADGFMLDEVLMRAQIVDRKVDDKVKIVGKYMWVDAMAMVLPPDDPEFKKLVDEEMRRMVLAKESNDLYDRWFIKPNPVNGVNMGLPMSHLLREFWKYPSDHVPF